MSNFTNEQIEQDPIMTPKIIPTESDESFNAKDQELLKNTINIQRIWYEETQSLIQQLSLPFMGENSYFTEGQTIFRLNKDNHSIPLDLSQIKEGITSSNFTTKTSHLDLSFKHEEKFTLRC